MKMVKLILYLFYVLTDMSINLMKYDFKPLSFTKHTTPVRNLVHWFGFGLA